MSLHSFHFHPIHTDDVLFFNGNVRNDLIFTIVSFHTRFLLNKKILQRTDAFYLLNTILYLACMKKFAFN